MGRNGNEVDYKGYRIGREALLYTSIPLFEVVTLHVANVTNAETFT